MITYTLNDLIVFWNRIRSRRFNAIIDVLDTIDDDDIPDEEKRELILDTLRYFGLYEIGYNEEQTPEELEKNHDKYIPMNRFDLELDNVKIRVFIIMN